MRFLDLQSPTLAISLIFACIAATPAQNGSSSQPNAAQKGKRAEAAGKVYQKWLNEDVVWIITAEERGAFKKLASNEDRDRFIGQFWFRRNPEPGSGRNSFKEEHYRRIAYSNVHFADSRPGWKTDRGRIYIVYGKPDSIESHPEGNPTPLAPKNGGGTPDYPYEVWHYQQLLGVGDNVEVEFIDECRCGEYRLALDFPR